MSQPLTKLGAQRPYKVTYSCRYRCITRCPCKSVRVEIDVVVVLLLKDLCCVGSLASQAALRDRLTGTAADKHGAANYLRVPSHILLIVAPHHPHTGKKGIEKMLPGAKTEAASRLAAARRE